MFRTIFTTLRALLKSGLCGPQLCIRSDTASYMRQTESISIQSGAGNRIRLNGSGGSVGSYISVCRMFEKYAVRTKMQSIWPSLDLEHAVCSSGLHVTCTGCPKKRTFRMLLEPQCTGSNTSNRHPLCMEINFLVVSC